MLVHCVACILYKHSAHIEPETGKLVLDALLAYSLRVDDNYYGKQALDWLAATLVHAHPAWLDSICSAIQLEHLFAKHPQTSQAVDEQQQQQRSRAIALLYTLSYVVQSERVIDTFVSSAFFAEFARLFTDHVAALLLQADNATTTTTQQRRQEAQHQSSFGASGKKLIEPVFVKLLIAIVGYESGQRWLGSGDGGCQLWQQLVELLCSPVHAFGDELRSLTIQLIKRALYLNEANQISFANHITRLIRSASHALTSFLHQLIVQVFLDEPTIDVCVERRSNNNNNNNRSSSSNSNSNHMLSAFKSACNSSLDGSLTHPRLGTGNSCRYMKQVALAKTCGQLVLAFADAPQLMASRFKSASAAGRFAPRTKLCLKYPTRFAFC